MAPSLLFARLLTATICVGLASGPALARGPLEAGLSKYRPNNPFLAESAAEQNPQVVADTPAVTRSSWPSPTFPSPKSAPPNSASPSQSDSELAANLQSITPWNPAPPRGIEVELPGESEYPTANVSGYFQVDSAIFSQSDGNKQVVGDIPNGVAFRRSRMAIKGDAYENVSYKIQMDFASSGLPSFRGVYMDFHKLPWLPGRLRIGQWKQPLSMDNLQSSRHLYLMERAMLRALLPIREVGIGLYDPNTKDDSTWAISGFRYPTGSYGNNLGDSAAFSMASRVTRVFGGESKDDFLLHVGGNYGFLNSSTQQFSVAARPEIKIVQYRGVPAGGSSGVPKFVNTGTINGPSAQLFGAELAGSLGSFWAQSEILAESVNASGAPNPTFWGGYIATGYVLTGEVRPYDKAKGVFSGVTPENPVTESGGLGAWELTGRISTLDLTDANISGGQCTTLAGGLNWFLNPRTKFQFNYIHALLDRGPVGRSDANVLAARAQVVF